MAPLLRSDKTMSMKQIEDSFGSNNCRCTGYRPILDAFKSFAQDSSLELQSKVADIEDLLKKCKNGQGICRNQCKLPYPCTSISLQPRNAGEDDDERDFVELALCPGRIRLTNGPGAWYRVTSVKEIFEIFTMIKGTYMLIAGNTAQGVFKEKYPPPPEVYIDINGVKELKFHIINADGVLVLGANMTLTNSIALFRAVAAERPATFGYLKVLAYHMTKVAHIPVRNIGTLAGNLSAKHRCPRFPSDLFTIFETVDAHLMIENEDSLSKITSLPEYLEMNMYKKVITRILFKPLDKSYYVRTYKVSRRAQNDHAVVNAGFCFRLDITKHYKVISTPRIVYGGIRPNFIHAVLTEAFFGGKNFLNTATLQKALSILCKEVVPDRKLPEASEQYRRCLSLSLFYKYVLSLNPSVVNPRFRSGPADIARPLSSGKQEYFSDPSEYPLTQPLPKIESLIQCSGEIEYTNDIPAASTELYASLVLSDRGPATLVGIDPLPALAIPGVVAFFSAKDIPGMNTFVEINTRHFLYQYEKLFADKEIQCAGQAVGVLLATNQDLADFAAERVVIKYANARKPCLFIEDVLRAGDKKRLKYVTSIKPTAVKR
ncbi:hypothetical protein J6590_031787 [Homalodisca vitripennis]|nr:hypothetical protein J6590_031787 [Homalodisca vitripennis]